MTHNVSKNYQATRSRHSLETQGVIDRSTKICNEHASLCFEDQLELGDNYNHKMLHLQKSRVKRDQDAIQKERIDKKNSQANLGKFLRMQIHYKN